MPNCVLDDLRKITCSTVLGMLLTVSANAIAEEVREYKTPGNWVAFGAMGTMIGANAWLASDYPNGYGALTALIVPIGIDWNSDKDKERASLLAQIIYATAATELRIK